MLQSDWLSLSFNYPRLAAGDSVNYPTAGNSGPPGQGSNHATPPSVGRAHPSQSGEPPLPQSTPPACHTGYISELAPARYQMRIWGGILVWRLSYIILLFGGSLGSGHSRLGALPQDSTPTTYYHTHQIRITLSC